MSESVNVFGIIRESIVAETVDCVNLVNQGELTLSKKSVSKGRVPEDCCKRDCCERDCSEPDDVLLVCPCPVVKCVPLFLPCKKVACVEKPSDCPPRSLGSEVVNVTAITQTLVYNVSRPGVEPTYELLKIPKGSLLKRFTITRNCEKTCGTSDNRPGYSLDERNVRFLLGFIDDTVLNIRNETSIPNMSKEQASELITYITNKKTPVTLPFMCRHTQISFDISLTMKQRYSTRCPGLGDNYCTDTTYNLMKYIFKPTFICEDDEICSVDCEDSVMCNLEAEAGTPVNLYPVITVTCGSLLCENFCFFIEYIEGPCSDQDVVTVCGKVVPWPSASQRI